MRIAKTLIGWLCLLSFLTAIGLLVGSTYIMVEPFWNGATVYRFPDPDLQGIVRPIAQGASMRRTMRFSTRTSSSRPSP